MSYFYGYGSRQHSSRHDDTEKKIKDIEKKIKNLGVEGNYKTVFDINLTTADKTFETVNNEKRITQARSGNSVLWQDDKTKAPTFGSDAIGPGKDYIENKGGNYMCFCNTEMQFNDVSVFVVCEVVDTSVSNDWCYLIGNDNGNYDKFLSFKSYSYSKLIVGGVRDSSKKTINMNVSHSILSKHIISCHWLGTGGMIYLNGIFCPGSEFNSDLADIGSPFGSIFLNKRLSGTPLDDYQLKGKIYGIKIIHGPLLPAEIVKINKDMMKEYGNFI